MSWVNYENPMDQSTLVMWLEKIVQPKYCPIMIDSNIIGVPLVEYHSSFNIMLTMLKSTIKEYDKKTYDLIDSLCDSNDEVCDLLRSGPKVTIPLVQPYHVIDFKVWVKLLITEFKCMERIMVQTSSPENQGTLYPCIIKLHSIFKQWYFQM